MNRAVERQHACVRIDPETQVTLLHSITSVPEGTLKLKNPYIISQTEDLRRKILKKRNPTERVYANTRFPSPSAISETSWQLQVVASMHS
jgi:hypothetical protein